MAKESESTPPRDGAARLTRTREVPDFKGITLQEQISKQYSPILQRQETDDFSPSLLQQRDQVAPSGIHPSQAQTLPSQAVYAQTYQGERGRQLGSNNGLLGLAVDNDQSVSLL